MCPKVFETLTQNNLLIMKNKLFIYLAFIANIVVYGQETQQKNDSLKNTVTLSEMVISANKVEEDKKKKALKQKKKVVAE